MSRIDSIPTLNWNDQARSEMGNAEALIRCSDFMWKVGEVAICGLIYETYTSPPWMWFALSRDVTMRDLIDFRRLSTLIPRGTLVGVAEDYALGVRFAEFYGFSNTNSRLQNYKIFRRL